MFNSFVVFFLGIAINKDGVIYFADGANIRTIDSEGTIHTLIGSQGHPKYFQPLPCYTVTSASDVCIRYVLVVKLETLSFIIAHYVIVVIVSLERHQSRLTDNPLFLMYNF